jgi:UDP-GlcNAc:undecaprenyl-phosphate/decaprenyl-phosphate GlcNAc-1-phosphate transferase
MPWLVAAASFFTCFLAIVALRPIAVAVNLIDRPGGRKTHHGAVPVIGGLAMFIATVLGVGLLSIPGSAVAAFLAACAVLVTVGLIDDRFDLSPWTRLPGQIAAAVVLIVGSGTTITTLGDLFGTGPILLSGYGSIAFTIFIIIAAINAFNMLDGLDGLAGTVALTALAAIAYLAAGAGLSTPLALSLVMIGAVGAFLVFNVPLRSRGRAQCFMGDAGSTLLGFTVAWLFIQISQGSGSPLTPALTLWFVALPLYELIWSTVRRIIRGVSPFKADTYHFHHMLLKGGLDTRSAFGVLTVLTIVLAGIGLQCQHYQLADSTSMLLLLVLGVTIIRLMYSANRFWTPRRDAADAAKPIDALDEDSV